MRDEHDKDQRTTGNRRRFPVQGWKPMHEFPHPREEFTRNDIQLEPEEVLDLRTRDQ
jgi:hypothetical protein